MIIILTGCTDRDTSLMVVEQEVSETEQDFEITLQSDQSQLKMNANVEITATLRYHGQAEIMILHAEPLIVFPTAEDDTYTRDVGITRRLRPGQVVGSQSHEFQVTDSDFKIDATALFSTVEDSHATEPIDRYAITGRLEFQKAD
jgi:hypothetical protein